MITAPKLEDLQILSSKRFRGKLHITEYVDITTGEIITAAEARKLGLKEIRPDSAVRREQKLNSLRKEVRKFAVFLLKHRSKAGGFLVDLDTLIQWYGYLEGKEAYHIRRYIPQLVSAGILDFDRMLNKDFMWFDADLDRASIRGNVFTAYRIFGNMLVKRRESLQYAAAVTG